MERELPRQQSGAMVQGMEAKVLFVEEVAQQLRCSRRTIERRLKAGTFPIKPLPSIDKRLRWAESDVQRFMRTIDSRGNGNRGR